MKAQTRKRSPLCRGHAASTKYSHHVGFGIPGAGKAHVKDATIAQVRALRIRGLLRADVHRAAVQLLALVLAIGQRMLRRRLHGRHVLEHQFRLPHCHATARSDALLVVVRRGAVKVAARAVLPTARGHRDADVDVIRPAKHLNMHAVGKIHVDDVLLQISVRHVHRGTHVVVAQGRDARQGVRRRKGRQDLMAIHEDPAVVLHGLHNDLVAMKERPADGDGMHRS
mmetsp:Transcript_47830/g.137740  ORF Transcript_47830/g.137740 Transcript_47830/m.137740 type:complete len:226 (-) Transcript_47830:696-1373(-)